MQSPQVVEPQTLLLIRAVAAWRAVRDSPKEGRAHADAIAAEARRQRDWPALVAALRARGWAERDVFANRAARETLDLAVRVAARHHLADLLAAVLATRASVFLEMGRAPRARRDIARARQVLEGASTPDIDLQAAVIEDVSGHLIRAAALYRDVLTGRQAPSIETAWTAHNNLGVILGQLGDVRAAEQHLGTAIEISNGLGRSTQGFAVHNMAVLAARAGRLADSLRRFDEAEAIFIEIDFPLVEHYLERIEVLVTLNLLRDAEAVANRAVRGLTHVNGALLLGEAQLVRARVLLARGALEDAEATAREALPALRSARGPLWKAHAEVVLIEARLRREVADTNDLRRLGRAVSILDAAGFREQTLQAQLMAARHRIAAGSSSQGFVQLERIAAMAGSPIALVRIAARVAATVVAYQRADSGATRRAAVRGLREIDRLRGAIPTAELRARASVHGVELAALGLRAALSTSRVPVIFDWIERSRQAAMLVSTPAPRDPEVDATLAELREVISRACQVDESDDDRRHLLRTQAQLEARVQRRLRLLDSGIHRRGRHATAGEVRSTLADRVLVAFAADGDRLLALTLTRRGGRLHSLGSLAATNAELDALLFAIRRLCRARTPASQDAAQQAIVHAISELDAQLLTPLCRDLDGADEVVVVPCAAHFGLPWHALPALAGRSVTVAPSATAWRNCVQRHPPKDGVLVVAGPGLDGAIDEARQVGAIHADARVLLPPESTVPTVLGRLGEVALAHFACHGDFRADNPAFSSLLLSDGPLTATDLDQLGTAPHTVILAACDVGAAEALPGEELLGFTNVLFALGSRCVVASGVPIPDIDSTPLMTAMHRHLALGAGSADALRRARRDVGEHTPAGLVATLAFGHFGA